VLLEYDDKVRRYPIAQDAEKVLDDLDKSIASGNGNDGVDDR